jgi:alkanesulfonate monooxygenase SsuD/methylene tetrahydromethanopterin reductase-like flavin-dependent oxidoreductase (luciferase family)
MAHRGLRFGIFLAPFHRVGDNPTLAIARDLELVTWLDQLGYDEAWIGEHHSAGWEIIASPEIFIAAAAERTKHIMLGSGVTSLPYHHPLLVAQRFVQLDHMTRGRVMLGCGPGALVSDAYMMGIDAEQQRRMMDESLGAIMRLLATLPVAALTESMRVDWAPGLVLPLAYLVLANSLIATSLLLAMIRHGGAARVSALFFLVPPLAALIAWGLLGEAMAPLAWAGTALAAIGVALARRSPSAGRAG